MNVVIRISGSMMALLLLLAVQVGASEKGDQERAKLHVQLASEYYERGHYGVALEEVNIALQAKPDYALAYSVRGLIHVAFKEDDEAEQNLRKALDIDPNDGDANHNYGWFLCVRRQNYAESLPYFLAALKSPLYLSAGKSFLQAGLCSYKLGELMRAEEYFESAYRVLPNSPEILLTLSDFYYKRSQWEKAKLYMAKHDRLRLPTARSLWLALRIERQLGNRGVESALEHELNSRFPDTYQTQLLRSGKYDVDSE